MKTNNDSLIVMHRDYTALVRAVYSRINHEVGYNKYVRTHFAYCPLYHIKGNDGGKVKICTGSKMTKYFTRSSKRELFKTDNISLNDMPRVINQYWKYGKALEQYLGSGVFTMDHFENNCVSVKFFKEIPFGDILWFITNAQLVTKKVNGVFYHYYELDKKPLDHKLVPLLVKAYRQLTLYFYKVEYDYDEREVGNLVNDYVINDATCGSSLDKKPLTDRLTARQLERSRQFINERVPAESFLFAGSTFPYGGSVVINNYDNLPVYDHIPFTFSSGATADKLNFLERRGASTPIELSSYKALWGGVNQGEKKNARLRFVPKDIRKPRTICMEPSYLGILQQFYMKMMYDRLKECNVCLDNQDTNRALALFGSSNGYWSTIDLSNASDSVMVEHVKVLFPAHFSRVLLDLRSECVDLPTGSILIQRKYAAMGSALTFPVETLLFASLAYAAGVKSEEVFVYGDDIIVPTKHAEKVIRILTKAGFTVSPEKSFLKGNFRESCGIFAYKGHNVSCVYRRKQETTLEHIKELRAVWGYFPNFGFDEMPAEGALYRGYIEHNQAVKLLCEGRLRFNESLQRLEVRNYVSRAKKQGSLPDDLRYIEWLRLYSGRTRVDSSQRAVSDFDKPIERKEWVQLEVDTSQFSRILNDIFDLELARIPALSLANWPELCHKTLVKNGWLATPKKINQRSQDGQHITDKNKISRHTGKNKKGTSSEGTKRV